MSAPVLGLTGLGNDYLVPGHKIELRFGQGQPGAPANGREILVAMPFLSTGSAVANTLYEITSVAQIKSIAGARSPARRAIERIIAANPFAKIWYLAVAETTGGSPVQADCDLTFTGTATSTATCEIWVGDEFVPYTYASGTTAAQAATAVGDAVLTKEHWPVTTTVVSTVCTLVAALKGASQGTAATGVHRVRVVNPIGTGLSVAVEAAALGLSPSAAGTDGSTTAAAQLATALATVSNLDKYYIVINDWDATSLTNLRTHIANNALPQAGRWQRGFAGFTGTVAAAAALAVAKNHERLELICQPNGNQEPAVMAANLAAIAQLYEPTRRNFNGFREAQWLVTGVTSPTDRPSDSDKNTAIKAGVTLVGSDAAGSFLVKRCTTRSKDSGGTVNDFRALEPHRVSILDFFAVRLEQVLAVKYAGWDFEDDEFLDDGSVNPNQTYAYHVAKPSLIKKDVFALIDEFAAPTNKQFKNAAAVKAGTLVTAHPTMNGVVQISLPADCIDILGQSRTLISEVGGR